jgi:hypothetical protein
MAAARDLEHALQSPDEIAPSGSLDATDPKKNIQLIHVIP